jgi:integrase
MARKVKDNDLGTRTARERLDIRGKPHFRRIEANLAIGYRRLRGKSGTWTARHYIEDGAYSFDVIGPADDRSDADGITVFNFDQAVAQARKLHTDRAKETAGIHGPMTVDQAMEAYIEHLDHNAHHSDNNQRSIIKYVSPLIGRLEVAKLTSQRLNAWKADIAAMSPRGKRVHDPRARKATANRTLQMLKAGLNLAYRNGKVSSDLAWKSVKPFKNVTRSRGRFLSVDEAKRLVNAAEPMFRPMIQAALATGCRYSELCNLKVHDYHEDSKTIFIGKSKSGKPRSVYLTDEGVRLFEGLAAGHRGSEPLIRRDGGLAFTPSLQIKRMRDTCERAKIDPPISFHGLRHAYASVLVKANVPLIYIAQSLGHANTRMVETHYGHLQASHLAETIRANVPDYGFAKSNVRTLKRS